MKRTKHMFPNYKYDAIVVLGGGIDLLGNLKGPSKCRIETAAELYQRKLAPKIITSSKWSMFLREEPRKTIAQAMKEGLIALGIPRNVIETEEISRDTLGNAYYTKVNHLMPQNLKK